MVEQVTAGGQLGGGLARKDEGGGGVRWDHRFDPELTVFKNPRAGGLAIRRHQFSAGGGERAARRRLDKEMFVARPGRIRGKAGDAFMHPLADRPVGVMVERVHPGIAEALLVAVTIPTLPHRGGSLVDRVEP